MSAEAHGSVPEPRRGDTRDVRAFSRARLRAWRHVRDISHARLADAAHTTPAHVAACEAGALQPDAVMLARWAGVLGCRPDQLCSATPYAPGEYWAAANEAMGPMSLQDLAVIADVILRSRAYRAQHDRQPQPGRVVADVILRSRAHRVGPDGQPPTMHG